MKTVTSENMMRGSESTTRGSENPKEEWLKEYSKPKTIEQHNKKFDLFCKWAKTDPHALVKEYEASDPRNFAKKWGKRIVQYCNEMIKQGYTTNYARTLTIAPRSFLKSQCIEVKIKRGAIPRAKMAMGEHEFRLQELQKMFRVGDIQDKARLATALSLGWGAGDFLALEWKFIEPYLSEELEAPVAFWHERKKTGAPSRSHLTHEAIESLREWRRVNSESKYVFSGQDGALSHDALNAWIKSLAKRAGIKVRGRIHFHLLRKFLMSQLSSSGMNRWETKLCVGKTVPTDILTYLKDLTEDLRNKFMNAEKRFTLTGITNANHSKLESISKDVQQMKDIIAEQQIKIGSLTKTLEKRENEMDKMRELVTKAFDASARVHTALKEMERLDKLEEIVKKLIKKRKLTEEE